MKVTRFDQTGVFVGGELFIGDAFSEVFAIRNKSILITGVVCHLSFYAFDSSPLYVLYSGHYEFLGGSLLTPVFSTSVERFKVPVSNNCTYTPLGVVLTPQLNIQTDIYIGLAAAAAAGSIWNAQTLWRWEYVEK